MKNENSGSTVFENSSIRVTVPASDAHRHKQSVMTHAMRALDHAQRIENLKKEGPIFDVLEMKNSIRNRLIGEYIMQNCTSYDPKRLMMRIHNGQLLSRGEEEILSDAQSYASSFFEPLSEEEKVQSFLDFMKEDPSPMEISRFFKRLILQKCDSPNHLSDLYEEEIISIRNDHARSISYSEKCINLAKGWKIEIIGKMPKDFPSEGIFEVEE